MMNIKPVSDPLRSEIPESVGFADIIDITSMDGVKSHPEMRAAPAKPRGSETAVWLETASIAQSSLPNRDPATFDTDEFYRLQQSILQSNGNLQPIKVRRLLNSPATPVNAEEVRFEVVFGHRRLHACHMLKLPVLAIIAEEFDDQQVLLERVRENAGRAEMSALDLGRICKRALDDGLFTSRKQLAMEFGRDEGDISRAITLADLPAEVIAAFDTSADLQYRHAKPLKDALKRDPETVVSIAREILRNGGKRVPASVVARLTSCSKSEIGPSNLASKATLLWDGKAYGELITDPNGKVTIGLDRPLDETARDQLLDHLRIFMKQQVVARSKSTQLRNAKQPAKLIA